MGTNEGSSCRIVKTWKLEKKRMKFNEICSKIAASFFESGDFVSIKLSEYAQINSGEFVGNDCVKKIVKEQGCYYLGFSDGSIAIANECKKNHK